MQNDSLILKMQMLQNLSEKTVLKQSFAFLHMLNLTVGQGIVEETKSNMP